MRGTNSARYIINYYLDENGRRVLFFPYYQNIYYFELKLNAFENKNLVLLSLILVLKHH